MLFVLVPHLKELFINHHTVGFGNTDGPSAITPGLIMRSLIHIEMNGIDCDTDDVLRSILACCPNLEVSLVHQQDLTIHSQGSLPLSLVGVQKSPASVLTACSLCLKRSHFFLQVFRATTNLGVMFPLREPEEHHPFVRAWHAFMRHRSAHPEHRGIRIRVEHGAPPPTGGGPHRDISAQIRARGQARARYYERTMDQAHGPEGLRRTINNEPGVGRDDPSEGAASSSRMDDERDPETLQEQARQAAAAGCVIVGFHVSAERSMDMYSTIVT